MTEETLWEKKNSMTFLLEKEEVETSPRWHLSLTQKIITSATLLLTYRRTNLYNLPVLQVLVPDT